MIELLIVIAVLIILISVSVFAFNRVSNSMKDKQTRGMLKNLNGMVIELEAADKLKRQPPRRAATPSDHDRSWPWWNGSAVFYPSEINPLPPAANAYTPTFWTLPYCIGNTSIETGGIPDAMVAPGSMKENSERFGSLAIVNTCLAMNLLCSVPANRNMINGLSAAQQLIPDFVTGQVKTAGADFFMGTADDGTVAVVYHNSVCVKSAGKIYRAGPNYAAGNAPPTNWLDITSAGNAVPLLLDAWNNPIIFVPGSGLRVRVYNGKNDYDPADVNQNWIIISPEGEVIGNGTGTPHVKRTGRPFWASAGPDGDFSTGEDNIYSFDK